MSDLQTQPYAAAPGNELRWARLKNSLADERGSATRVQSDHRTLRKMSPRYGECDQKRHQRQAARPLDNQP